MVILHGNFFFLSRKSCAVTKWIKSNKINYLGLHTIISVVKNCHNFNYLQNCSSEARDAFSLIYREIFLFFHFPRKNRFLIISDFFIYTLPLFIQSQFFNLSTLLHFFYSFNSSAISLNLPISLSSIELTI